MKKFFCCLLSFLSVSTACFFSKAAINANAEESFSTFRNVYTPDTGICAPPSVIADVTNQDVYSSLDGEKSPAIAIYTVDDSLNVVSSDGKNVLGSLSEAILKHPNIIPAVYISNETQTQNYIEFIKKNSLIDAFVVSSQPELVKTVRETCIGILGAIDFSKTKLDENNPIEIRSITNKNSAHIAILSSSQADAETVDYLRHRLQNIWVKTSDSLPGMFTAAQNGAAGIINESPDSTIDFLESFTEPTMFKTPLLIGHTGDRTHSENTIASALSAVESGSDGVECDIQLTKDKKIVLMHDSTLDRTTNGTGTISEMTLEEIQQYTVVNSTEKVPSFEDYLSALKGKNCVIYVEFKYNVIEIVPYVKELIDKYDISEQIVFITFHTTVLSEVRKQMPEIPASFLVSGAGISDSYTYSGLYNCGISPNYVGMDSSTASFLLVRGIGVNSYTYNSLSLFDAKYMENHTSMTSDYPTYALTYASKATALFNEYYLYTTEDRAYSLVGNVLNRLGDEIGISAGFIVLESDTQILTTETGDVYGAGDGYAYISFYGVSEKLGYRVYSAPVPVIIGKGALPVETPVDSSSTSTHDSDSTESSNGCGSLLAAAGECLPLIVCAYFIYHRKKHI